jgi:hypothetical protein
VLDWIRQLLDPAAIFWAGVWGVLWAAVIELAKRHRNRIVEAGFRILRPLMRLARFALDLYISLLLVYRVLKASDELSDKLWGEVFGFLILGIG